MNHRVLVRISVDRRFWHGLPTLEPACIAAFNVPMRELVEPNPEAILKGSFRTYKKDWPALHRWLKDGGKTSRVVLGFKNGCYEGVAVLCGYKIGCEQTNRPDIISGSLQIIVQYMMPFDFNHLHGTDAPINLYPRKLQG